MFPRRNKAHRYALPSRGHQWRDGGGVGLVERRTWLGLAASESCSNHFPLGRTSDRLADFRAEIPAANARDPPPRIDRSTRKIFLPPDTLPLCQ